LPVIELGQSLDGSDASPVNGALQCVDEYEHSPGIADRTQGLGCVGMQTRVPTAEHCTEPDHCARTADPTIL
jgi:hypothetical protein